MKTIVSFHDPEIGWGNCLPCESFNCSPSERTFEFIPKRARLLKSILINDCVVQMSKVPDRQEILIEVTGYQYINGGYQKTTTKLRIEES
jgi:hypothetical protein